MKYILRGIWSAAALAAVFGCGRLPAEEDVVTLAAEVRFDVSAGYEPETRTAFSGEVIGDSRTYERIDWTDGDVFCVYSDGAATEAGNHVAGYAVTAHSADGVRSLAAVKSDAPLLWGAGTHSFYALYPAPGGAGVDAALALDENTVTGYIPEAQVLVRDGSNFVPDMHYAYMYAAAKVASPAVPGPVSLAFKPLVTTYRISLLTFAADPVNSDITSACIQTTADGGRLSGGFTAVIQPDGQFVAEPSGEGSAKVTFTFPDGVRLSQTKPIVLTLFSLPVAQTDLELVLTFSNGLIRRLALSDGGSPVRVTPGEKIYLENVAVPDGWAYHVQASDPSALTDYAAGGSTSFTVNSYRTKGGVREDIPWVATFSENEDGPYSDTPPEGFTLSTTSGTGSEVSVTATVAAREGVTANVDLTAARKARFAAASASPRGTESAPFDLSMFDLLTNASRTAGHPVTANSYIVDRAGWYMLPLVYGNAIDWAKAKDLTVGNRLAYDPADRVYGNNTPSSEWYMLPFQNVNGTGITTPFIIDDLSACGFLSSETLAGHKLDAVVVWQDVAAGKEFVTRPEILWTKPAASNAESGLACPYLRFRVFENAANYTQGNALIAIRDVSGAADPAHPTPTEAKILWSWHIWSTDISLPAELKQTVVRASTVKPYNLMMPCYLGYCDPDYYTETSYEGRSFWVQLSQPDGFGRLRIRVEQEGGSDVVTYPGSNTYYNWGRKDPLLPGNGEELAVNKNWVSAGGYTVAITDDCIQFNEFEGEEITDFSSAASSILYPMSIVYSSRPSGGGGYQILKKGTNLWNATVDDYAMPWWWDNSGSIRSTYDRLVVKTVYDPCPPGFCIPHAFAMSFMVEDGWHSGYPGSTLAVPGWNNGFVFKCENDPAGIRFPSTGSRNVAYTRETRGQFLSGFTGKFYDMWSPVMLGNGASPLIWGGRSYSAELLNGTNSVGHGYSIRPVVEDNVLGAVAIGIPYNRYDWSTTTNTWN